MHEAAVAQRVIETVRDYGELKAVFVAVGKSSCVHPMMLRRSFDALKDGTSAWGAKLVTVDSPGEDIMVLYVEV